MDTTITRIGAVVVAELRSVGYMESTIGQYGKVIKALAVYAKRRGAHVYTPALGAGFASMTTSPRTGRFSAQRRFDYRRLVALFDSYVTTGIVLMYDSYTPAVKEREEEAVGNGTADTS